MPKNIIFDFDSTLVTIEGLDELAKGRGLYKETKKITDSGMNGSLAFSLSLKKRFALLSLKLADIEFLTARYKSSLTPGAKEVISSLQSHGHTVFISTGGIKAAILPVAKYLGIKEEHVFAVCTTVTMTGGLRLKDSCLMTKDYGKAQVIEKLKVFGPTIMIGDGMTDFEAGKHADKFIGFGGIVERESVKSHSEAYITDPALYKLLELC